MSFTALQELCEIGSEHLIRTEYLDAEVALSRAEEIAWQAKDWDTLARLYMPLQEARRQRRQRCGEGTVAFDLIAQGPDDHLHGRHVLENFSTGQLLVAGWGTIEPALAVRRIQAELGLYVESFLAAVYPVGGRRAVVIAPFAAATLPPAGRDDIPMEQLLSGVPPHSLVLWQDELPRGVRRGNTETYAQTMSIWERLHTPFLTIADADTNPIQKMGGYRRAIEVDYACELAHQKLSDVAHAMARSAKATR